jgi:hypothetical protein
MARNGDVMRSDRLKQVMQQIDPNFDERNAGFNRFSKFVVEAGQKGVVLVTKLDNGQFEVAPPTSAGAPVLAAVRPARDGAGEAAREDGSRRGRGRRGRGRDRERPAEGAREAKPPVQPARDGLPSRGRVAQATLTLAGAFQLMSQALAELRAPVSEEALRLRMVAMHGREDPLLDAGRFGRLLRQANDAEVADVRQVGDNEHEVSPHPRAPALPPRPAPLLAVPAASLSEEEPAALASEPAAEPASSGRENGQRLGVRFRRGSRGPLRTGEIPLIGVVRVESAPPVEAPPAAEEAPAEPAATKPARPRRAPRKRAPAAAAAKAAAEPPTSTEASEAPRTARPRRPPRARKKAE